MKKIENLIEKAIESTVKKGQNIEEYFDNITRYCKKEYQDECNIYQVIALNKKECRLYITDFMSSHYGYIHETMLEIVVTNCDYVTVHFVRDIPKEYENNEDEYIINYIVWNENTSIIYNMNKKVYQVFDLDNNLITETITLYEALQV